MEPSTIQSDVEDRDLIEKLATLQDMYNQISQLRMLLPDKLVNPMRAALENPERYSPEKLAAYLKDAAVAGSKDINRFKKDYHSESMRELWQTANTAEVPQGSDGWTENYLLLANAFRSTTDANEGASKQSGDQTLGTTDQLDDISAVKALLQKHPDIPHEIEDETKGYPVNLTLLQMSFRIDQDPSRPGKYTIFPKPGQKVSALAQQVMDSIRENNDEGGVLNLVVKLAHV